MKLYPVMFYVSAAGEVVPASETDQALSWSGWYEWRTKDGEPLEPVGLFAPSQLEYEPFRQAVEAAQKRARERRRSRLAELKHRARLAEELWERIASHASVRKGWRAPYKRDILIDVITYGIPLDRAAVRHLPGGIDPERWKADMRRWISRLRRTPREEVAEMAHLIPFPAEEQRNTRTAVGSPGVKTEVEG